MNDHTTDEHTKLSPFLSDTDTRFGVVHHLRTTPPHFQATWDGRKTFEIRYDDRGYQAGDTVVLEEYDARAVCECIVLDSKGVRHAPGSCPRYTGRTITAIIGWVQASVPAKTGGRDALRFYGNGWVILSLVEAAGAEPLTSEPPLRYVPGVAPGNTATSSSNPSPASIPPRRPDPGPTRPAYSTSTPVVHP